MRWSVAAVLALSSSAGLCLLSTCAARGALAWGADQQEEPFERQELPQFQLRPPFFLVGGRVPNWDAEGDTVITDDYVRLTPDEQSRKGALWSQYPLVLGEDGVASGVGFEAEFSIQVGNTKQLGADGMAFWYVSKEYNTREFGPAMGGQGSWRGVGVVMDSFDNDGQGGNPSIQVLWNDGSWTYTPDQDGTTHELGSCRAYFRNNHEATRVRISYWDTQLRVQYMGGSLGSDWQECVTATVGDLGANGKVGFTAATGGVSDNHDVISLNINKLLPRGGDRRAELNRILTEAKDMRAKEEAEAKAKAEVPPPAPATQQAPPPAQPPAPVAGGNTAPQGDAAALPPPAIPPQQQGLPPQQQGLPPQQQGLPPQQQGLPPQQQGLPPQQQGLPPQQQGLPPQQQGYPVPQQDAQTLQTLTALHGGLATLTATVQRVEGSLASNAQSLAQLSGAIQSVSAEQVALKQQIDNLVRQQGGGSSGAADLSPVTSALESARRSLEEKLEQVTQNFRVRFDAVQNGVNDLRSQVDHSVAGTQRVESQIQQTSGADTGGGWVLWVVLVQVLLAGVFIFWKKWRDEKKSTKLY